MMSNNFIIIILLFCSVSWGQKSCETEISKAIVYKSGAMVTRQTEVSLSRGRNEIILKNLPYTLDENSLSINTDHNKTVEIIDFVIKDSKIVKSLVTDTTQNAIDANNQLKLELLREKNKLKNQKSFYENFADSFLKGLNNSDESLSSEEVKDFTNNYFHKEDYLEKEINKIDQKIIELARKISRLQSLISQDKIAKEKKNKEVKILLDTDSPGKVIFEVSYLMSKASWTPHYNSYFFTDTPASLFEYMATVEQSTEEDWNNIKIVISEDKPFIKTRKVENEIDKSVFKQRGTIGKLKGVVTDESGEPLCGANITIEGTTLGAETDEEGYYYIIGIRAGTYKARCEFIGYEPTEVQVRIRTGLTSKQNFKLFPMSYELEEVVYAVEAESSIRKDVTNSQRTYTFDEDGNAHFRGGRSGSVNFSVDGVSISDPTSADPVFHRKRATSGYVSSNINYSNYSSDFILPGNYTIKSGKNVKINLAKIEFVSKKTLYALPDISNKLYAEDKFINESGLVLLQGQINHYLDNSFISSQRFRRLNPGDSLTVSFGQSRDVVLKRKVLEEHTFKEELFSKRKITTIKMQTILYNVSSDQKEIVLKDPLPLAYDQESIKIKLKNEKDWNTSSRGFMQKEIALKPGEVKKIDTEYSIEYPDEMKDIIFQGSLK